MKKFRTFGVLLDEKKYVIQGDSTKQKAKVFMYIYQGHWELKHVVYDTTNKPYSRNDWKFLKDLAIYVEYLCAKADKEKLEMGIPEELDYQSRAEEI